jgi:hypothetical protein
VWATPYLSGAASLAGVTAVVNQPPARVRPLGSAGCAARAILQVDRPSLVRTRFGSWLLRGVEQATFEDQGDGTRLTHEFWTNEIISAVMARIFAFGSVRGQLPGRTKYFARASSARHVLVPRRAG